MIQINLVFEHVADDRTDAGPTLLNSDENAPSENSSRCNILSLPAKPLLP